MAVIIGIHGLANKPDEQTLRGYWLASIEEGLEKNCDLAGADLTYEMVYWADAFYAHSQHRMPEYYFDALYNHQPYIPATSGQLQERVETRLDRLRRRLSDYAGSVIDWAYKADILDEASDWVIKRISFTRDLQLYYENPTIPTSDGGSLGARTVLHERLRAKLHQHKEERLMLIAHSMGTIVAYDVLRDVGLAKRRGDPQWADFECPFLRNHRLAARTR